MGAVGDFADFSSQMASTAISSLTTYGSDSSDDDSDDGTAPRSPQPGPPSIRENLPAPGARLTSTALATAVVAAPVVELNASMDTRRHLDPSATQVILTATLGRGPSMLTRRLCRVPKMKTPPIL